MSNVNSYKCAFKQFETVTLAQRGNGKIIRHFEIASVFKCMNLKYYGANKTQMINAWQCFKVWYILLFNIQPLALQRVRSPNSNSSKNASFTLCTGQFRNFVHQNWFLSLLIIHLIQIFFCAFQRNMGHGRRKQIA